MEEGHTLIGAQHCALYLLDEDGQVTPACMHACHMS